MPEPLTPESLRSLPTTSLLELFRELDAPALEEMHGDYSSELLRQPTAAASVLGRASVDRPLWRWRSKGFRPVDARSGRGYNSFQVGSRIVQRYPMQTRMGPSRFDGRPAYHLLYPAFRSTCGAIGMVDEVRVISDGLYLGIGTWGFSDAQRHVALPFLLTDTGAPYLGDIGTPRPGWVASLKVMPNLGQPLTTAAQKEFA